MSQALYLRNFLCRRGQSGAVFWNTYFCCLLVGKLMTTESRKVFGPTFLVAVNVGKQTPAKGLCIFMDFYTSRRARTLPRALLSFCHFALRSASIVILASFCAYILNDFVTSADHCQKSFNVLLKLFSDFYCRFLATIPTMATASEPCPPLR